MIMLSMKAVDTAHVCSTHVVVWCAALPELLTHAQEGRLHHGIHKSQLAMFWLASHTELIRKQSTAACAKLLL